MNVLQVKIHFQIQVCKEIVMDILVFWSWSCFWMFNYVLDFQQVQVQPQSSVKKLVGYKPHMSNRVCGLLRSKSACPGTE